MSAFSVMVLEQLTVIHIFMPFKTLSIIVMLSWGIIFVLLVNQIQVATYFNAVITIGHTLCNVLFYIGQDGVLGSSLKAMSKLGMTLSLHYASNCTVCLRMSNKLDWNVHIGKVICNRE